VQCGVAIAIAQMQISTMISKYHGFSEDRYRFILAMMPDMG
jgi:hypothetical protein